MKYTAQFIPLSSKLLYLLQQVAKHDPLQCDDKCEEVFQEVRDVLGAMQAMQAPIWEEVFYVNPSIRDNAIGLCFYKKGRATNICA